VRTGISHASTLRHGIPARPASRSRHTSGGGPSSSPPSPRAVRRPVSDETRRVRRTAALEAAVSGNGFLTVEAAYTQRTEGSRPSRPARPASGDSLSEAR
jgi:hypothetical protein